MFGCASLALSVFRLPECGWVLVAGVLLLFVSSDCAAGVSISECSAFRLPVCSGAASFARDLLSTALCSVERAGDGCASTAGVCAEWLALVSASPKSVLPVFRLPDASLDGVGDSDVAVFAAAGVSLTAGGGSGVFACAAVAAVGAGFALVVTSLVFSVFRLPTLCATGSCICVFSITAWAGTSSAANGAKASIRSSVITKPAYSSGASGKSCLPCNAHW